MIQSTKIEKFGRYLITAVDVIVWWFINGYFLNYLGVETEEIDEGQCVSVTRACHLLM